MHTFLVQSQYINISWKLRVFNFFVVKSKLLWARKNPADPGEKIFKWNVQDSANSPDLYGSQTNKVRDQTHQCDVDISWYFKVVGNSENSKFEIVWTDFKGRSHGPRLRMLLNRRKKSPTYVPSRRSMRPKLDRLAERVKGVYHALGQVPPSKITWKSNIFWKLLPPDTGSPY